MGSPNKRWAHKLAAGLSSKLPSRCVCRLQGLTESSLGSPAARFCLVWFSEYIIEARPTCISLGNLLYFPRQFIAGGSRSERPRSDADVTCELELVGQTSIMDPSARR
jgi:hypothetical protein